MWVLRRGSFTTGLLLRLVASFRSRRMTSDNIVTDKMDIADMRTPYHSKSMGFDVEDLASQDPITQFRHWFDEACERGVEEPNAMALATANSTGKPSVRMVLMKGFDEKGFKFFTNHSSHKATDLKENPHCSLMFYWQTLKRQVRIEGSVEKLTEEESTEYFHRRPRPSQIGAVISQQSSPVASRQVLEDLYTEMEKKYPDETHTIPKPEYWGGYRVKPDLMEFWQGQTNRVHDRIVFRKPVIGETVDPTVTKTADNGWVLERLCP